MAIGSLPPLSSVRVFEAAARLLSFTQAAAELGMTQAAVSYQIKLLEERLGTPLFLRLSRRVELTEAGARLAPAVSAALEALQRCLRTSAERGGRGAGYQLAAHLRLELAGTAPGGLQRGASRHCDRAQRVEPHDRLRPGGGRCRHPQRPRALARPGGVSAAARPFRAALQPRPAAPSRPRRQPGRPAPPAAPEPARSVVGALAGAGRGAGRWPGFPRRLPVRLAADRGQCRDRRPGGRDPDPGTLDR